MTRRTVLAAGAACLTPGWSQSASPFVLPALPYAVDALEPYIDARTMEIHHGRHHQAYVDNLNKALAGYPQWASKSLEEILKNLAAAPESIRTAVRNNGGGHANHSLFWQVLGKGQAAPKGELAKAVETSFGSVAGMKERLKAAGLSVFGSGWVWLTGDGKGQLKIETSPNQDSPWMEGRTPLLGIDVWEHAYYLRYQNRRADYLEAVLQVINWEFVSARWVTLGR